jgi:hypothetical protein
VIGSKYGFYSHEHSYFFSKTKLNANILDKHLLSSAVLEREPKVIEERLSWVLDQLTIDCSQFKLHFLKDSNADKFFDQDPYDY